MKKAEFDRKLTQYEEYIGRTRCWRWFPPEVDEHRQRISVNGRRPLVHRYVYEVLRQQGKELAGPLKKNQPLVRTCDNPRCVSPFHAMPALSQREIAESGEWTGIAPNDPRGAHNRAKDCCRYGHAYTTENTSWTNGKRHCLACKRERAWLPLALRHLVHGNRHQLHVVPGKPIDEDWDSIEEDPSLSLEDPFEELAPMADEIDVAG